MLLLLLLSYAIVSDSLQTPWTIPSKFHCLWDFLGKNTGVSSHSLLQGIFLPQGLNPGPSTAGGFFTIWATREAHRYHTIKECSVRPCWASLRDIQGLILHQGAKSVCLMTHELPLTLKHKSFATFYNNSRALYRKMISKKSFSITLQSWGQKKEKLFIIFLYQMLWFIAATSYNQYFPTFKGILTWYKYPTFYIFHSVSSL